MSANCDVIVIFSNYGQFGAIQKPDSRHTLCKTYIFIKSNILSYKNWNQNYKISNTALIGLSKGTAFAKKLLRWAKLRGPCGAKRYTFWNYICVCTYVQNFKFLA